MVNNPYKTVYEIKFLWFPKIVNGKLCWLKDVTKMTETYRVIIDGSPSEYDVVKWLGVDKK